MRGLKVSPNSLRGRKVYALLLITIMVLAPALFAGTVQLMGQSGTNAGGLQGTDSITSMVSQVWGYNGSAWQAATLTLTPGSEQVAAAFTAGFNVQKVIVATANSSYNVVHLLQKSLIYTTTKVTLATTASTKPTLNSVYEYLGTFTNSTATTALGDKAVTSAVLNQTLFAGSTNNLGQPVEYNMVEMFASPAHSVPLYTLFMNGNNNKTGVITVTFVNYLSYPFTFNLVNDQAYTIFIIFLLSAMISIFFATPRLRGSMSSSERRAHSWAFRERELPYVIGTLVLAVLEAATIWVMGTNFPGYFGSGGAIAAFAGFTIGIYLYSVARSIGRFDVGIFIGLLTSVLFIIINIPLLFGPMIYNMWAYGTFVGEFAAVIILFSLIVLMVESFFVTKRADLV